MEFKEIIFELISGCSRTYKIKGIGFDGAWVPKDKILIDSFNEIDLEHSTLPKINTYLVLCLEVAEHLPKKRAELLIAELASIAPVVVFSGAIPNQGGTNHINENWQSYWISLFEKNNYVFVDCLRPVLWNNANVAPWYKQNIFFFVDKTKISQFKKLHEYKNTMPTDVVHPEMYNLNIGRENTIRDVIEIFADIPHIIRKKLSRGKNK